MGHIGLCVTHVVLDRVRFGAVGSLVQKHRAIEVAKEQAQCSVASNSDLLPLLDLTVSSACALHDAHNALT
eukprot:9365816-Lingulodinium_polyedra.AAC.1